MPRIQTQYSPTTPPLTFAARVAAALSEHRYPQALDLAKQAFALTPSEENREQLRTVYDASIRFNVKRNAPADARRLLDEAEKLDGPVPAWWESLALLRAQLGDSHRAMQLLEKAPDSTVLPRVQNFIADRAMADRQRGRDLVPHDQRAGFDIIRDAFAHYDASHDEAARQSLQAIGLNSPFLEWKLFLRGLMAFSANDDARAIENWQRLDPERMPAHLAEPFRYHVDSAYRGTLKADKAKILARQAENIGQPILNKLRELQRSLGSDHGLPQGLKQASSILDTMKVKFPQLVPKLANCFYHIILMGGQPNDLDAYARLFGPHPDDPHFDRLRAQVMEAIHSMEEANHFWKTYADWIVKTPERWSGTQGKRAQAMIYMRMGDNAAEHLLDDDEGSMFNDFMDIFQPRRKSKPAKKPLKPDTNECYRLAMKFAPEWIEPASRLMMMLVEAEKWEEAEEVGRQILAHSPDDVDVLMSVSGVQVAQGKISEALENMRHALKNNPLDRNLRTAVAAIVLQQGRAAGLKGTFDEARASFAEASALVEGILRATIVAAWAACEWKAGDAERATQLAGEVSARESFKVAVDYLLLVECSRIKVNKDLLKERQARFDSAIEADRPLSELVGPLLCLTVYRDEKPKYRGIGTHEKKISARVLAAIQANPAESDLENLGRILEDGCLPKILKACAERGVNLFPKNPLFPFLMGEQMIQQRPKTFSARMVAQLFKKVLKLTEGKSDDANRLIREAIDNRRKEFRELDDWMSPNVFNPW